MKKLLMSMLVLAGGLVVGMHANVGKVVDEEVREALDELDKVTQKAKEHFAVLQESAEPGVVKLLAQNSFHLAELMSIQNVLLRKAFDNQAWIVKQINEQVASKANLDSAVEQINEITNDQKARLDRHTRILDALTRKWRGRVAQSKRRSRRRRA